MIKARHLMIILIVLSPLAALAAGIYEMVTDKDKPLLYLLLAVIPGAFIAAVKELRESDLFPPELLVAKFEGEETVKQWTRNFTAGSEELVDLDVPIRIGNNDPSKEVTIRDVQVVCKDPAVELRLPGGIEVLGKGKGFMWQVCDNAYPELFNDGNQKTIEARQVRDYHIGVQHSGYSKNRYELAVSFTDNWNRQYMLEKIIQIGKLEAK